MTDKKDRKLKRQKNDQDALAESPNGGRCGFHSGGEDGGHSAKL